MKKRTLSTSEGETQRIARELIEKHIHTTPLVIMLYGNLGAGKTVFVKELGRALGVDDVVSPAFVVYYEYPLKRDDLKFFYHFDLYRIEDPAEFDHLGVEELLEQGNVLAIEWSEKSGPIDDILRKKGTVVEVHIEHAGENTREITIIEPES